MFEVALKMLLGDRAKFYGLVFGIAIGTFLMAQQVSIFIGVLQRTASQIIDVRDANIWVMQSNIRYIDETDALRDIDLLRVRSVPGVEWAEPLFKGMALIQSPPQTLLNQSILIGVDDASLAGMPARMIYGRWENIKMPNAVIIDKAGWKLLWGSAPFRFGKTIQINDQRLVIVGMCDTSAPFLTFPVIYTRYTEAVKLVPRMRNYLTFILVKPLPSLKPSVVAKFITARTGLKALTSAAFSWQTIEYYLKNTGIPVNFGITILLGFFIGAAVASQTFYLFIHENLRQFAALKTIGVTNSQILLMVLSQAAFSGYIGFGCGIGCTSLFFEFTSHMENLRGIYLTWPVIVGTALAIVIIIFASSFYSIRKVLQLPPSEVFQS